MRSITNITGIILIVLGILSFAYQGFSYTTQKKVAEIGDLKITADTEKTISFPPVLGGLSIAAGIALVVITRINKK
ncbi:MAG TPA: DUF3185 domain-containing protein [Gammaproteobacteria bacterium]|nr:DUF3185 domain-containing protein [Gammaproteobacteria bacterium]